MYMTGRDGKNLMVIKCGLEDSSMVNILTSDLMSGAMINVFTTHMEVTFSDCEVRLVCGTGEEISTLRDRLRATMMLK